MLLSNMSSNLAVLIRQRLLELCTHSLSLTHTGEYRCVSMETMWCWKQRRRRWPTSVRRPPCAQLTLRKTREPLSYLEEVCLISEFFVNSMDSYIQHFSLLLSYDTPSVMPLGILLVYSCIIHTCIASIIVIYMCSEITWHNVDGCSTPVMKFISLGSRTRHCCLCWDATPGRVQRSNRPREPGEWGSLRSSQTQQG